VAELTGIPAEDVIRLAREYATTKPSLIRLLIGLEHNRSGAMMFRTISCLPVMVGAWRHRGGGLTRSTHATTLAVLNTSGLVRSDLEDVSLRSINMARIGAALTSSELEPPLKAMIVYGCNPAVMAPNQSLVVRGAPA
jgi:anaerobic selenocysteine-containing dehydrogenase